MTRNTVHTSQHINSVCSFFTPCCGCTYWPSTGRKIWVQKEKCYRRCFPFTINLLKTY